MSKQKSKIALGIDIGGTGIKGALVDLDEGTLASDRLKIATPKGGSPKDIIAVVAELTEELVGENTKIPVGVTFPAIVRDGRTMSAANVSKEWIGLNADKMFEKSLKRTITFVNDADAAGYAEAHFGAAKGLSGLTILTTLGTGIGSALIYNGTLIPNSELGHLSLNRFKSVETWASNAARERENLSFAEWAKRLQVYYTHLELLFSPKTIVVGGGISKQDSDFLPLITTEAALVPAKLRNQAGIIGAAMYAHEHASTK